MFGQKKTVLLCFLLLLGSRMLSAQVDFEAIETEILTSFQLLKQAHWAKDAERQQIFSRRLKHQMTFALVQQGSYYHAFDRLKAFVKIIESSDKKIRIFSWDALAADGWRQIMSYAQYRDVRNQSLLLALHDERKKNIANFNDVGYDQMYKFVGTKGEDCYLISGYGSHGLGQHHRTLRLLRLVKNELSICLDCFDGLDANLVLKAPLQLSVDVSVSIRRKKITFYEVYFEETLGELRTRFRSLNWNGRFFE